MSSTTNRMRTLSAVGLAAVLMMGCDEKPSAEAPAASTPPPMPELPAPTVQSSEPAPTATAPKPSHECPKGSTGEGTYKEPCVATGTDRMMEVTWNGKLSDEGPSFRVSSKSDLEIMYGQILVYFYDKSGKQLEVPASGSDEARPKQRCSGNIFAGPMKPKEKAVLTFSCVKKSHVPEGTAAIEAEMQKVGFSSEPGKKADTYWENKDLTPDERPKGGIKKKK